MIEQYNFTYAQKQILYKIKKDFYMWDIGNLEDFFPNELLNKNLDNKQLANQIFNHYVKLHDTYKYQRPDYNTFNPQYKPTKFEIKVEEKQTLGLGYCPVASNGTRCCNLYTLDAVESCGFDCSYCSIQTFYNENKIVFDKNFKNKLKNLTLDKNRIYHIGTGQSSDSLMWGNKEGILEALFEFANQNSNVVLELKTKSNNIKFLLENDIPKNIITTWSLNPQIIIDKEEHLTATLDERIQAAKQIEQKGNLVGFHFHPIIAYQGYLQDYEAIYKSLITQFNPKFVALVSMGTLTFIKSVLKKLQKRDLKTKVTQIPLRDVNHKKTYDYETKLEMFRHCYNSFKPWHKDVFFYMCMEEHSLWKDVFGYEYSSNNQFEDMMNSFYMAKINNLG
jgi:spore photoproduct lyase